jgi:hypothetical protein
MMAFQQSEDEEEDGPEQVTLQEGREEAQKVRKDENESKKRLGVFFSFLSLHFSWHTSNSFFFHFSFFRTHKISMHISIYFLLAASGGKHA